jgi:hypothetical protein
MSYQLIFLKKIKLQWKLIFSETQNIIHCNDIIIKLFINYKIFELYSKGEITFSS